MSNAVAPNATRPLVAFVRLSRLPFLLGGFLMFALGAAFGNRIDLGVYVLAQSAVTLAQITAHYLNEYADYEADLAIVNRTAFSGGSGVLTSGHLSRHVALRAGQTTTVLAIVSCLALSTVSIPSATAILLALAISWAYSMPPVRLLSTGWGELATAVAVTALVPLAGASAQHVGWAAGIWFAIASLLTLQLSMLLAFELPDLESDKAAGKRVLGTRLGFDRTVTAIRLLIVTGIAVQLLGCLAGELSTTVTAWSIPSYVTASALTLWCSSSNHGRTTFLAVATFFLSGSALLLSTM